METLRGRDLRAISDFLDGIYNTSSMGEIRDRLVANLSKLFSCDLASYDEMNTDRRTSVDLGDPPDVLSPEFMRERWLPVMHEHPVLMHTQRTGDIHALRITDFLSQRKFRQCGLYGEFYRKLGVEDVLCKAIQVSNDVVIGCAVHRSRPTFTDKDKFIFDLIGSHVTQAWRNAEEKSRIDQRSSALERAAECLGYDLVTVSPGGRTTLVTSSAQSILEEFFGRGATSDHRLPAEIYRWLGEQIKQWQPDHLPQPAAPLIVEHGTSRLTVRLLSGGPQHLLILQKQRSSIDLSRAGEHKLSPREMDVLGWVAEGKTNAEVAAILDMSARTVQKHLEHVFIKLGVETRLAAVNALRAVPRRGQMDG